MISLLCNKQRYCKKFITDNKMLMKCVLYNSEYNYLSTALDNVTQQSLDTKKERLIVKPRETNIACIMFSVHRLLLDQVQRQCTNTSIMLQVITVKSFGS
jgi:hypothetical protein